MFRRAECQFRLIATVAACCAPAAWCHGQVESVGDKVRVDTTGGTAAANEISACGTGSVLVAGFNDWRLSGAGEVVRTVFSMSFDGGATWVDEAIQAPIANQGAADGDPITAIDPRTGTIWAGGVAFNSNGGVYVARLDPGSGKFTPSVMAFTGVADKPWMAAGPRPGELDSTRLYIAFHKGLIWSDDMGDTWTEPVIIGVGLGHLPHVGPNGELYVAWWDLMGHHHLKRSYDGGETFTTHLIATRMDEWGLSGARFPGTFRAAPLLLFDVDPATGDLYAMYPDTTAMIGSNANVDLYFTKSTDDGATWTTPVIVNTDAAFPGDQFFGWIEVDDFGRLHVVFLDSRHTVQGDNVTNGMFDAYYMYSLDHGATWTEIRLTDASWNSDHDGLDRTNQFIGDYLGLAMVGSRAHPMYLSTAAGDPDIFTREIIHRRVGDFNSDDTVNVLDLMAMLSQWGPCGGGECTADLNEDGVVNVLDLLLLLGHWG